MWMITNAVRNTPFAHIFYRLENAIAIQGEQITRDPLSQLVKVNIAGKHYYVKKYYKSSKHFFMNVFFKSRVRREWENLNYFSQLGFRTPTIASYGETRTLGYFNYGALITEEVCKTKSLDVLAEENPELFHDRAWKKQLFQQVTEFTRALHQNHFYHIDLKWRNLLVQLGHKPIVFYIDCPYGRHVRWPFASRYRIKDLACLDKLGKKHLSRTDRLRFYLNYCEITQLRDKDKQTIRKIQDFFRNRE